MARGPGCRRERAAIREVPMHITATVIAAALLAACATQPLTAEDLDGRVVCDVNRMAEVDRTARRQFMDLRWVNCPQATVRVQRD
jgi:hypothetical protein